MEWINVEDFSSFRLLGVFNIVALEKKKIGALSGKI